MTAASFSTPVKASSIADLNEREDVYEWEPMALAPPKGPVRKRRGVSWFNHSGSSPFNSSLLSASADGTDAFFFTRDALVHGDENGSRVRYLRCPRRRRLPVYSQPSPLQSL